MDTLHASLPALRDACRRWSDRPAITFRGRTISYGEFGDGAAALAASFRRLGVASGDRIICQLPNSPEYLISLAAAWECGAVLVGVDHDLTGAELASLIQRTEAVVLLYQPRKDGVDRAELLSVVRESCPEVAVVVHGFEPDDPGDLRLADLLDDRDRTGAQAVPVPVAPERTATLLLTSGTTGLPKCAVETFGALWGKISCFADAYRPGPEDVHLLYLPLAHAFGLKLSLTALTTGGRLVLMERFSPEGALQLITDEGVSVLPGTPTHFQLLLDRFDPARHDVTGLRWSVAGAATFPRPLLEKVYGILGVDLLYVYGCSEGFFSYTTDREEIRAGSVGHRVFHGPPGSPPNGRMAVMSTDEDREVPDGVVGEIVFGAANPVRYWGRPPVATAGWYRTGDLGLIDSEGRLFIKGRIKELVNRGGLKVSCGEVEAALTALPEVVDAAVVPVPDPVLGEVIGACVVPATPGGALGLEEIRALLGRTLARHKLPDRLWVTDAIPRTKVGKVDRSSIRFPDPQIAL
ncbi:class I adenylate-forming enzyme family protein [Kitasatospora sp. NPDC101235]|uniref:class I adenylate-forming enzyme family protein n=1 Tax=Kitasatospora sp. NPDC101235 TaxID=3364101 RepID=UPI003801430F